MRNSYLRNQLWSIQLPLEKDPVTGKSQATGEVQWRQGSRGLDTGSQGRAAAREERMEDYTVTKKLAQGGQGSTL